MFFRRFFSLPTDTVFKNNKKYSKRPNKLRDLPVQLTLGSKRGRPKELLAKGLFTQKPLVQWAIFLTHGQPVTPMKALPGWGSKKQTPQQTQTFGSTFPFTKPGWAYPFLTRGHLTKWSSGHVSRVCSERRASGPH